MPSATPPCDTTLWSATFKRADVASPLVSMTPHGTTHEGRTLYHVTITSEANFKKLDQIKADNARLADPRTLSDPAEVERIVDSLPGIAWMAYSIHGDELSGCDAAVQVAYQLAAGTDETTRRLRDELVIHIDPLQNPDGRERLPQSTSTSDRQGSQHRLPGHATRRSVVRGTRQPLSFRSQP